MSRKTPGGLRWRLVAASDVNPYLRGQGRPAPGPGLSIVSRTLAAHFALYSAGGAAIFESVNNTHAR
jgi:hypothetical protein